MTRGLLFVITAPSGAGKSSLIAKLLEDERGLALSVSYTTRAPRPGEQNGREGDLGHHQEIARGQEPAAL